MVVLRQRDSYGELRNAADLLRAMTRLIAAADGDTVTAADEGRYRSAATSVASAK